MNAHTARTDKILVVDDDARIRDLLRRYLTQEGFEVMVAEDGKALSRILLRETVDLIVLDLMMPGEDGLSICRRLRAANDRTPIIMLTAKGRMSTASSGWKSAPMTTLASRSTRVNCLRGSTPSCGAGRRRRRRVRPPARAKSWCSARSASTWARDCCAKSGEELPLTTGEFAMLKALVRHPRQPMSREKLAQLARGREFEPFDRSLDVQISRLRKMIENDRSGAALHPDGLGGGLRVRAGRSAAEPWQPCSRCTGRHVSLRTPSWTGDSGAIPCRCAGHWSRAQHQPVFWRTFILLGAAAAGSASWPGCRHCARSSYEPRAVQTAQQIASLVNLSRAALIHCGCDRAGVPGQDD
jgi:two-component system phosphate regulon response regulator OmpR